MTMNYLRSLFPIARLVHPGPTWREGGRRLLFVVRHLLIHRHSRRWLAYLATERMNAVVRGNPSLYRKPIRPYVSIHWPTQAKVSTMIYHYEFLSRTLAPAVFRSVVSPVGWTLNSFPIRNGDQLTVRLRYDGKFRKEGEVTLDLESAQHGCRVSSITFVVAVGADGGPSLAVGAVSGLPAGSDKDIIKSTAKAMFGLRPKALLLIVLQELARAWNVHTLLGVGNRAHTSRHLDYLLNHTRKFAITYDQFWCEAGGTRRSDGFFTLPGAWPAPDFANIASHKRSLHRQRHALIAELQPRVVAGLGETRPVDATPAAPMERSLLVSAAVAGLAICWVLVGTPAIGAEPEDWSIHGQTTVIEQWHDGFEAAYSGTNSLNPAREDKHTATLTVFLGRRLWPGGEIYYNPEMTQGTGLSGTLGLAGFPNGEATRAGSENPEYNTARLFLRQTFGLGGSAETTESGANQLAGPQDPERLTLTLGKLSATDLFDDNAYSHDPRTQLLNWALMDNGAWDYPADAKGYTGGFTADLRLARRSLRWGIFMEPAEANGRPLDPHLSKGFGQAFEWEERYSAAGRPGVLRVLAYWNQAHMGSYAEALRQAGPNPPDVTLSRRYRSKAGAGLNWEQQLAGGLGAFARLGFNDGHNETWAFTEIDRTASAGLNLKGTAWKRPDDTVFAACVINGLSPEHRRYLAAGGYGFIIGDGFLRYGAEEILETGYDWKAARWLAVAADLQLADHPAYNHDRGPVKIAALRLHSEF